MDSGEEMINSDNQINEYSVRNPEQNIHESQLSRDNIRYLEIIL